MAAVVNAQDYKIPSFPVDDQNYISYQDVIKADSITKDRLYNAAKAWFVASFENSRFVIQSDNPTSGSISGRGSYEKLVMVNPKAAMGIGQNCQYTFLITIECKDNRYRYTINDVKVNGENGETFISRTVNKRKMKPLDYVLINNLNNTLLSIESSIKAGMAKTVQVDNW